MTSNSVSIQIEEERINILNNVELEDASLRLLSHSHQLLDNVSVIMVIRHSEVKYHFSNPEVLIKELGEPGPSLTPHGKRAAVAFGRRLPTSFRYRLFHTRLKRTQETAENIREGLRQHTMNVEIKGIAPYLMLSQSSESKIIQYMMRDKRDFVNHWISNRYPPDDIESSESLARRAAAEIETNLQTARSNSFDIYVAHDVSVLQLLFFWFGEFPPIDWIQFLDGFILQLHDDSMVLYWKEGMKDVWYPYWWNKISANEAFFWL